MEISKMLRDMGKKQGDMSREISTMWEKETEEVKQEYRRRAALLKEQHSQRHPGYRYRPGEKKRNRAAGTSSEKAKGKGKAVVVDELQILPGELPLPALPRPILKNRESLLDQAEKYQGFPGAQIPQIEEPLKGGDYLDDTLSDSSDILGPPPPSLTQIIADYHNQLHMQTLAVPAVPALVDDSNLFEDLLKDYGLETGNSLAFDHTHLDFMGINATAQPILNNLTEPLPHNAGQVSIFDEPFIPTHFESSTGNLAEEYDFLSQYGLTGGASGCTDYAAEWDIPANTDPSPLGVPWQWLENEYDADPSNSYIPCDSLGALLSSPTLGVVG
ncbi:hypothetical protein H0H81_002239 [Sphagnurus paluster]|uniref:HMG box domain-containing protein n=1 Tax=Sphagnurus paluster TaxID=117069 RepID=A0A9P7K400_9AGAR|nr:hypothetical protein H0H81_002239 [Sphagnurus paluster]